MSKSKRTGRRPIAKGLGDVTINDFANSTVVKSRPKKSLTNVTQVLKKEVGDTPEKLWDEQIEDFDYITEENEDGEVILKKVEVRRRKKTLSEQSDVGQITGNDYPIDIWFLISEYIRPEDVGRFACICKTSCAVVNTAKFWYSMYKKHYKTKANLPERLQPQSLLRFYGVRTAVIRALHYLYNPFIERISSVTTFETHPDVLIKRQCVTMWHQEQNKQWLYYFKLKEHNVSLESNIRKKVDLIELLEDVSANPDENCRVLLVTCKHFIPVPAVLGYTLTSVSLNLSHGLRHHRLQLGFGSGISSSSVVGMNGNPVIHLDPVINIRVLDWWHPLYPHSDNIELLLSVTNGTE